MTAAFLVAFVAIVWWLQPSTAHASTSPDIHADAAAAGGMFLVQDTQLVVERLTVVLDCGADAARRGCALEATYDVSNPTDGPEEVLGVYLGSRQDDCAITIDGVDVRRRIPSELVAATLGALPKSNEEEGVTVHDPSTGFVIRVEARRKKSIRFSGRLEPTLEYTAAGEIPAVTLRHPFMGPWLRREQRLEFRYRIAPVRTWRGNPAVDVTIRSPASWVFTSTNPGWTTTRDGASVTNRLVTTAGRAGPRLSYTLVIPAPSLAVGGPFFGVGAELQSSGPRFRVGYEIGVHDWLLASLAYESSSDGGPSSSTIVASAEAASDALVIISLSAGLGVPVELRAPDSATVGVRGFVGVALPLVTMLLPVDFYFDGSPRTRAAIIGQLSF